MNDELPRWEEMTYDQQRAFLGLKDVRGEIARYELQRAWRQIGAQFEAISGVWTEFARALLGVARD